MGWPVPGEVRDRLPAANPAGIVDRPKFLQLYLESLKSIQWAFELSAALAHFVLLLVTLISIFSFSQCICYHFLKETFSNPANQRLSVY